jgi:hypothetical protein
VALEYLLLVAVLAAVNTVSRRLFKRIDGYEHEMDVWIQSKLTAYQNPGGEFFCQTPGELADCRSTRLSSIKDSSGSNRWCSRALAQTMVEFAQDWKAARMFDLYPRGRDGVIIANSVEVTDAARPHFEAAPLSDRDDGRNAIIILGAGYTGLSAALKLAELRQVRDVPARIILLDARRIGDSPSGKSAGHICGLQARPGDLERHCGPSLAGRLIAAANGAPSLVRYRVAQHGIPCNLRDGYIFIRRDGTQTLKTGPSQFSIDPYPYVLGLAFACRKAGVKIHEKTEVVAIRDNPDGREVTIAGGMVVRAACVIAAGGHRMAERIALLHRLRAKTTEL